MIVEKGYRCLTTNQKGLSDLCLKGRLKHYIRGAFQ